MRRGVLLAFALLGLLGCGADPKVVRVYEGRIVEGPYVPSEAYTAYLEGTLAEEGGDLKTAIAAYARAANADDEDPEVETRLGDARCKLDPKDRAADEAFTRAAKLDASYAPLLAAKARCQSARGDHDGANVLAENAVRQDAKNPNLEALRVRIASLRDSPDAPRIRERAIALTLSHGERAGAWEALIAWGRGRHDHELLARGLEGLVRTAPIRSPEVEAGAVELLGAGQAALARRVAAALVDAPRSLGIIGPRDATVARLAVDEALLRGDDAAAQRRAVRGHVSLAEVAARALLLDRRDAAQAFASQVTKADPTSSGAFMVLAALGLKEGLLTHVGDRPPEACALAVAERLAATSGSEVAKTWLANIGHLRMPAHDPVVGPLAVDLAARGVIVPAELPAELRIELAARRREAPPALEAETDAKHQLLWHVLSDPRTEAARTLLAKLSDAGDRDPIVGFAVAKMALASGKTDSAQVKQAVAAGPANPLLLSVAVELAKRAGRSEDLTPARARLMAVARTPAERALAKE